MSMLEGAAALAAIWLSAMACLSVLIVFAILFLLLKVLGAVRRFSHRQLARAQGITATVDQRSREGVERLLVRPTGAVYGAATRARRTVEVLTKGPSKPGTS
jgi:hypothetical protein